MSGSPESPLPPPSKRIRAEHPEKATTMLVWSGSPKSGKSALMESESLDPDQPQGFGIADVPYGLKSLYESMRTWYERYTAAKKPRKPGRPRPLPPAYMMFFPRLFAKSWGYDRLYPHVLDVWCLYHAYLEIFYKHNCGLATSDPYRQCLDKEIELRSKLMAQGTITPPDEIILSDNIMKCAIELMVSTSAGSSLAKIAAACIANEDELIIERLRIGSSALDPEEPPNRSTQIRRLALEYMQNSPCDSDVALLAVKVALLGITKEAELMVQNLRSGHYNSYMLYQNRKIRGFALQVVRQKLDVFSASANMALTNSADDYKAKMVAVVEEDAEKHSWLYLVEYDLGPEEAPVIENSEIQQLEEGVVHHMLPHGDEENNQKG